MADTKIPYATKTWNVLTGCTPASEGCKNCWARELHEMRHKAFLAGKKMPDGSAVFSWSNPDPEEGDQYLWGISGTGVAAGFQLVGQPSLTIPADQATEGQICVDVSIVRKDRRASVEPARACAE